MGIWHVAERAVRDSQYRQAHAPNRNRYGAVPRVPAAEVVPARAARAAARSVASGAVAARGVMEPAREVPSFPDIMNEASERWLKTYVHFPSSKAADIVLAWALHTHFKRDGVLVWKSTPRLGLFSVEPASGKSTVLELLNLCCPDTYGLDINPTQYGLQRSISEEHATILLDEGDVSAIAKSTIAIWNAGYTRNGHVLNGTRNKPSRVPVFGPIALAALMRMKQGAKGEELKAAFSRTIEIVMEPGPHADWSEVTETAGRAVHNALAYIAQETMPDLDLDMPLEMPKWLADDYRKQQIWRPLFLACEAVGGDWPDRIRAASKPGRDFPHAQWAALSADEEQGAAVMNAFSGLLSMNEQLSEGF